MVRCMICHQMKRSIDGPCDCRGSNLPGRSPEFAGDDSPQVIPVYGAPLELVIEVGYILPEQPFESAEAFQRYKEAIERVGHEMLMRAGISGRQARVSVRDNRPPIG